MVYWKARVCATRPGLNTAYSLEDDAMQKHHITPAIVKELLDYDPESGVLTWKPRDRSWFTSDRIHKSWNTRFSGKPTGHTAITSGEYRQVYVGLLGHLFIASHLIWMWMTGDRPPAVIDHEDRDSTNNVWSNLRASTPTSNARNMSRSSRNRSGVTGVAWHSRHKVWRAMIGESGRLRHLGSFDDWFEAVCARKSAELDLGYSSGHGQEAPYRKQ